ncbi:hypothetical protein B0H63DRAFT_43166 [Podospora didyma]|uniref:Uncharacterized protein n=1 Tax=Podospora didyma TaxID=330526 RepID=A0AAE0P6L5_9PEZI|nr:hypothetical protein B0H63DRAFT_43166 [Podospora didyma]
MAGSRQQQQQRSYHVESSWRMVEGGDNDSFDTSILNDEEELNISSGSDPSHSQPFNGSQPFSIGGSQPFSIGGSQDDSIENFLSKAENDEQVILRTPFRPSVPQSVRHSSRENRRHRSPEPEFYMPKVEVDSPRRDGLRSGRTVQTVPPSLPGLRRRQGQPTGDPTKPGRQQGTPSGPLRRQESFHTRLSETLLDSLLGVLSWILGLVGSAFRFAQKPLAFLVSLYLVFGALILVQNMATKSITTSLSPVCRLPGASWINLPFCPDSPPKDGEARERRPVEFDHLVELQNHLADVVERSAEGVSLPMEMKRSESSIRDLRTMVRYSNLARKEELVLEFDGFITIVGTASRNLQVFNSHVGSVVDAVISINRWTSGHLDDMISDDRKRGLISDWATWIFAPFQPAVFSEQLLLNTYTEHTSLVANKIAALITEAEGVLNSLTKAEDHLGIIHDFVTRTEHSVQGRKDEILWTLWTLIGVNSRHLTNLNDQLALLRQVNAQRSEAVKHVTELLVELGRIQATLGDLHDSVAAPELTKGKIEMPLSVHIETINRGVERLELARSRIREVEKERVGEVLARGGKRDEKLIESA